MSVTADDSLDSPATEEVSEELPVDEDRVVPAKRFNGLQAKLQQVLAENKALKAKAESPTPRQSSPEPQENDLLSVLAAKVADMEIKEARAEAAQQYPEVKPLLKYLTGDSKADVLDLAKSISEDLKAGASPAQAAANAEAKAAETNETPRVNGGAPVNGGGAAITDPTIDDEIAEARKRGDWQAFFRLKQKQGQATPSGQ